MPSCNARDLWLEVGRGTQSAARRHRLARGIDPRPAHQDTRLLVPTLDGAGGGSGARLSALRTARDRRPGNLHPDARALSQARNAGQCGTAAAPRCRRQAARQERTAHLPPCRAVEMLRASVPQKVIGDLLGHRSTEATVPYLKLATEDLRAIALDVPGSGVLS